MELQERWLTTLSSSSRYANQAEAAIRVTDTIAGDSHPPLHWLTPVIIDDYTKNADNKDMWGLSDDLQESDPMEPSLDPEQVALLDLLEDDNQDELKPELEAQTSCSITLNWELPDV